jgi:hypothetical protein
LVEKPTLRPELVGVWGAYTLLSGSRPMTEVGPGPIPLTEIKAYLEILQVEKIESRLYLIRMVKALDDMYLENYREKTQANLAKKAAK